MQQQQPAASVSTRTQPAWNGVKLQGLTAAARSLRRLGSASRNPQPKQCHPPAVTLSSTAGVRPGVSPVPLLRLSCVGALTRLYCSEYFVAVQAWYVMRDRLRSCTAYLCKWKPKCMNRPAS